VHLRAVWGQEARVSPLAEAALLQRGAEAAVEPAELQPEAAEPEAL
jgi:hypothetical protein